jgi:hypothetical protein
LKSFHFHPCISRGKYQSSIVFTSSLVGQQWTAIYDVDWIEKPKGIEAVTVADHVAIPRSLRGSLLIDVNALIGSMKLAVISAVDGKLTVHREYPALSSDRKQVIARETMGKADVDVLRGTVGIHNRIEKINDVCRTSKSPSIYLLVEAQCMTNIAPPDDERMAYLTALISFLNNPNASRDLLPMLLPIIDRCRTVDAEEEKRANGIILRAILPRITALDPSDVQALRAGIDVPEEVKHLFPDIAKDGAVASDVQNLAKALNRFLKMPPNDDQEQRHFRQLATEVVGLCSR